MKVDVYIQKKATSFWENTHDRDAWRLFLDALQKYNFFITQQGYSKKNAVFHFSSTIIWPLVNGVQAHPSNNSPPLVITIVR